MKAIDNEVPANCSTPKREIIFFRLLRGLRLLVVSPHRFFLRAYQLLFRQANGPEISSRPKTKPIVVYTEVTAECNNRCVYCAIDRVKRTGKVNEKVRDAVAKLISSHPEINFRVYFHLVGEPLMYDGLEDYIKLLTLPNADLWVCTNGILLTDARVKKLHAAGLRNIWCSFFYTNESDYKKYVRSEFFSEAEKNLYNLISKNNLFEKIHIVTFSKCAEDLEKAIHGKENISFQKQRKQIRWTWIGRVWEKFICVSVDGDVCLDWRDYNFESSLGKIYDFNPQYIIERYKSQSMIKSVLPEKKLQATC